MGTSREKVMMSFYMEEDEGHVGVFLLELWSFVRWLEEITGSISE